ncbi:MAG: hypothetical protein HZC24_06680 [Rhodocyclales bacterium]|nr:hypothetical protein [Rhodocyclales bacterium]
MSGSKVYDRSSTLSVPSFTLGNLANGDDLTASGSVVFSDSANVGSNKPLAATDVVVTGAKVGNYSYAATLSGTGNITARPLSIDGLTIANKVYDGNTTASVTGTASFGNIISGDAVSVDGAIATASFLDANAGTGKPVSVAGLSLTGVDAGNYTLTATANIDPRPLTLSVGGNKVYDRSVVLSAPMFTLGNVVVGDTVGASGMVVFSDSANVGDNKPLAATDIVLTGAKAGNYLLSSAAATGSGSIGARPTVAWLGGVGYWSDASKWESGALPDGNNVLAVTIPAGSEVTFDGASAANGFAGYANLNSLTSLGGIRITSGTLAIVQSLTTANYDQTGGTLSGNGMLTVNQSFSKTGGTIALAGLVGITQASGHLIFTNDRALTLGAVIAAAGDIDLDITGGLTSGAAPILARAGSVRLTVHSPLVIGAGGVEASNGITLAATTPDSASTITLNGPMSSSAGTVAVNAYGAIAQNADIAGANISVASSSGSITVASTAVSTVAAGGSSTYSAPQGGVSASAGNFAIATPVLTMRTATSGNESTTDSLISQQVASNLTTVTEQVSTAAADTQAVTAPLTEALTTTGATSLTLSSVSYTVGGSAGEFGGGDTTSVSMSSAANPLTASPTTTGTDATQASSADTGSPTTVQAKDEKKGDKAEKDKPAKEEKKETPKSANKRTAQCS